MTCMYAYFGGRGFFGFGDFVLVLFLFTVNYDAILYLCELSHVCSLLITCP